MGARTRMAALLMGGLLGVWSCAPMGPPDPDEAPGEKPPTPRAVPGTLKTRIEAAVKNVRERTLLRGNAFWTVFHGILGLGPGVQLTDSRTGAKVNALQYIQDGGELRGLVFQPTDHGLEVVTLRDSQGQGHQDQFVAEMAQWGMPADRIFKVQGRDYKFLDFVKNSQMRARTTADQELSWTIVVVSQYFGTDAAWTNAHGERLRLEDLVRYEVEASVEKAPCGGTHRLFGLTWAYHLHLARGGKAEGVWKAVSVRTDEYMLKAKQSQWPDGLFSTASFESKAHAPDKQLQLNTTGHIFEWLALALPDGDLRSDWMQGAASALAQLILDMQDSPMDSGSMYHAVHGLYLYHARVWGGSFAPPELMIPLPPGWPARKG